MAPVNFTVFIYLMMTWLNPVSSYNHFYKASDSRIQYVGRIDFSNPDTPRFWAPGCYIIAKFSGQECSVQVNDQMLGNQHNWITYIVDNQAPKRIKLTAKNNVIKIVEGLSSGDHRLLLCKATESGIGYLEFIGIICNKLKTPAALPIRKIEFIGDSQTAGSAADNSEIACGAGQWYDQEDAYDSYGAVLARNLNAQWQIAAVSSIGLTRSCCKVNIVMPQVYDKMSMYNNSLAWDFSKYIPDLVMLCLGENDAQQDSAVFCNAYIRFIKRIRGYYPSAEIICLSSPRRINPGAENIPFYLRSIVAAMTSVGDKQVYAYEFSKQYIQGCAKHPSVEEHKQMADELLPFVKSVMSW